MALHNFISVVDYSAIFIFYIVISPFPAIPLKKKFKKKTLHRWFSLYHFMISWRSSLISFFFARNFQYLLQIQNMSFWCSIFIKTSSLLKCSVYKILLDNYKYFASARVLICEMIVQHLPRLWKHRHYVTFQYSFLSVNFPGFRELCTQTGKVQVSINNVITVIPSDKLPRAEIYSVEIFLIFNNFAIQMTLRILMSHLPSSVKRLLKHIKCCTCLSLRSPIYNLDVENFLFSHNHAFYFLSLSFVFVNMVSSLLPAFLHCQ